MTEPPAIPQRETARIWACGVTDVGRVREHNEDFHHVDPRGEVFVCADGMGGQAAGEVASRMAVEGFVATLGGSGWAQLKARWLAEPLHEHLRAIQDFLVHATRRVHHAIYSRAQDEPDKRGMGTTFEAMVIVGRDAFLVHVGDSRIYLLRDENTLQVTQDHSLIETMLAAGRGTREELKRANIKSALVNAMGATPDLAIDVLHFTLTTGDRFVLCTDGLHEYFPDEEELRHVLDEPGEAGVRRLVGLANERGGKDNITCVLVDVQSVPGPPVPRTLKHDLDALKASPLLEGLSFQETLKTLRAAVEREVRPGEALPRITTGDDTGYMVLDGEVRVDERALGPGSLAHAAALIGENSFDGFPHAPLGARVLAFRRNDFEALARDQPALGVKLLLNLARILAAERGR
jgi:serine/threonine protein phosphatase PrpC